MLLLGFLLIVLMKKIQVYPVKYEKIIDYGVFPVDSCHRHLSLERCGREDGHVGQEYYLHHHQFAIDGREPCQVEEAGKQPEHLGGYGYRCQVLLDEEEFGNSVYSKYHGTVLWVDVGLVQDVHGPVSQVCVEGREDE